MASWEEKWKKDILDIRGDVPYKDGSERLRALIKKGLLRFTDLRDKPDRFFLAHRLLANHAYSLGPGFWIRFTVQFNLFAGTVLALGSKEQVKLLDGMQERGDLGCFGLTERFAGVNSGLVVNTTAEWDEQKQMFRLHSPNEGAFKNWISQGLTADKCAVIADLIVKGKSHGPHGFLMDFRQNGQLVKGVTIGDMGRKTVGNDLDNAWVQFENVWLPKAAMLNRYVDIDSSNNYVQKVKGIRSMDMIGQRLFTGRVAVAQAAVAFSTKLYEKTKEYSDTKKCWAPSGPKPSLSDIPQLKSLYKEAEVKFERLKRYLARCETELSACLTAEKIPPTPLVEAIAVAKVAAVETSIDLCFRLKQEVGSYALMGGTGFEQLDFLQCCKFAEGDSRILMLKMARDRVRNFAKESKKGIRVGSAEELQRLEALAKVLATGKQSAWDDNWTLVYGLSEAIIKRVMDEWAPASRM